MVVVEPQGYERIQAMYLKETVVADIVLPDDVIVERISRRSNTSSAEAAKRAAGDMQVFKDIDRKVRLILWWMAGRLFRNLSGRYFGLLGIWMRKVEKLS